MKDFIKKYFGLMGTIIYFPLAIIVRIPVALLLILIMIVALLILPLFTGKEYSWGWVSDLYSWYTEI